MSYVIRYFHKLSQTQTIALVLAYIIKISTTLVLSTMGMTMMLACDNNG
jgi:hypothetical protein